MTNLQTEGAVHVVDGGSRLVRTLASLALLAASLVVLAVGGFIQFDDTSGSGANQWVMSLGTAAALLVLCSLGVGLTDRTARRMLGGALALLDALLVVQTILDDGFRFIWGGDQAELFIFQVALALAALSLLTPTFWATREASEGEPHPPRTLAPWPRAAVYTAALVVVAFVAFLAGTEHFVATQCGGDGGECDIAPVEGIIWAGVAIVLGMIAIGVAEAVRGRGHRHPLDGS